MTAKTAAQRKAAERKRARDAGLTEVRGVYAPPDLHALIRKFAEDLKTEYSRKARELK